MRNIAKFVTRFREVSPFVGSLSSVRSGIRSALRMFAKEYQLDEDSGDSVTKAIIENMYAAIIGVAELTKCIKTLVEYNAFLQGGANVPEHIFIALIAHYTIDESLTDECPEDLTTEYCGRMIWRMADTLMKDSLQDMCAEALSEEKK